MLDDLGNLGDFLGGIGVIVTLVYLALQIRQNSRLMRASTLATTANAMSGFNNLLGSSPTVARVFQLGLEDFPSLSDDERRQFINLLRAAFTDHEHVYRQYDRGLVEEPDWAANRQIARDLIESPSVAAWWARRKRIFSPEFVRSVEAVDATPSPVLARSLIAEMERATRSDGAIDATNAS